jgi:hypothetical protein
MIPIVAACTVVGVVAGLVRRGGFVALGGLTLFAFDHWRGGAYRGSGNGLFLTVATIVFFAALGLPGYVAARLTRRRFGRRRGGS